MHLHFRHWGALPHLPSQEKTSRDENGAACEALERSHEGFPLLETSPRGYPRGIMHSLPPLSPSTALQKRVWGNFHHEISKKARVFQNRGLILVLPLQMSLKNMKWSLHCRVIKGEARRSLAMSKKPTPDIIFHLDQTSNATPLFLLVFGCLGFCASKWWWIENDKEIHLHSLPPHITLPLWATRTCSECGKAYF